MTLDELIRSKRIRKQEVGDDDIRAAIEKAKSDLDTAKKIVSQSHSWGFAIAYNAVLQAARAYVFASGYRPASHEGHKNTFLFLQASMAEKHQTLITFLDRMRVKRNQSVYDVADLITESEAEKMLVQAEEFIEIILSTEVLKLHGRPQ